MSETLHGAEALRSLQHALEGWPDIGPRPTHAYPAFRRLDDALRASVDAGLGQPDLAGLLRSVLRSWGARTRTDPSLRVPTTLFSERSTEATSRWNLECTTIGDSVIVRARPWAPTWLAGLPPDGVDGAAAAGHERRADHSVPADPFFASSLGYPTYRSPGQRAAIRALMDAPPGSALAVVLPTGEGKSACFYLAARVGWSDRREASGTIVVITPTVALALDHEENARTLGFAAPQLAYRANDAGSATFAQGIRDGSIGICFASPEAALGPLLPSLRSAAKAGLIAALVIDEAHLIDAWGGVFRPDFQLLAGLRRELVDLAPQPKPRTLFLTATLTETAAAVLKGLFVPDGDGLPIVAAPTIRPEHDYWTAGLVDQPTQDARVDEAVDNLPRPLIVYATSRSDVARHYERLRQRGYRRVGWMTGDSSATERKRLLDSWRNGSCDIIVATSAFGLGVNYAEVRAVVHACVPEGIDRFYQEVGRSGRDGRAAVSVIIPTRHNLEEGRGLARQKLITPDKGYGRWRQMFLAGSHTGSGAEGDVFDLEFDIAPGADPDRIDMRNEQNTSWNLRVISMMAASGLVSLRRGPRYVDMDGKRKLVLSVNIEDPAHLVKEVFDAKVAPYRERVANAGRKTMAMMERYLAGNLCIRAAVSAQYAIEGSTIGGPDVTVRGDCPGCSYCRPTTQTAQRPHHPQHPWPVRELQVGIANLLDPCKRLVVTYDGSILPTGRYERERRVETLRRLLRGSIRSVRLDTRTGLTADWLQDTVDDWPLFIADDLDVGGDLPDGPILVLRADADPLDGTAQPGAPPTVVFAPDVSPRYAGGVLRIDLLEKYLLQ